jgi:hypothetical protein
VTEGGVLAEFVRRARECLEVRALQIGEDPHHDDFMVGDHLLELIRGADELSRSASLQNQQE